MITNEYFDSLNDYLQNFCEKNNFYPTSDKEFNDFVRSYCGLDNLEDFFVEVQEPVEIENESTILVPISSNQPFYAFIPSVWKAMTDIQRVQAIAMTFNYICNEISPKLLKKPQLIFVDSNAKGVLGYCTYDDRNQMFVSLSKILADDESIPSKILGTIMHELTHAEQHWEFLKNFEYLKTQDFDFSKLTNYQKRLLFQDSQMFEQYVNDLYERVSQGGEEIKYLSDEDMKLWLHLEKEDIGWGFLKDLLYACDARELYAENNAKKLVEKISRICPEIIQRELYVDHCLNVLKEYGYEISHSDIENFTQMSCVAQTAEELINGDEMICKEIEYLLNIYRTKKVEKPFMENYEEFENKFLKKVQIDWKNAFAKEDQQEE